MKDSSVGDLFIKMRAFFFISFFVPPLLLGGLDAGASPVPSDGQIVDVVTNSMNCPASFSAAPALELTYNLVPGAPAHIDCPIDVCRSSASTVSVRLYNPGDLGAGPTELAIESSRLTSTHLILSVHMPPRNCSDCWVSVGAEEAANMACAAVRVSNVGAPDLGSNTRAISISPIHGHSAASGGGGCLLAPAASSPSNWSFLIIFLFLLACVRLKILPNKRDR